MNSTIPNIPDRYEILCELGSGGMGRVYKAHDRVLDQFVALKVLQLVRGTSDEQILRFNKEARACARLNHPNIIRILDFGFFDDLAPYMVLEFVEGQTLKDYISETGPLSSMAAKQVFGQVTKALSHAHDQKIVHRDLKASNILVTDSNDRLAIKLFDFGIARILEDTESMQLTGANAFIGTPTYMSPEQIKNEAIDARSDIYSLGCVMFEAMTGQLPFSSSDIMTLLEAQLHNEPPQVGSIVTELSGSSLETVIDRCLEKNPEDRFQSSKELLTHLVADDRPIGSPANSTPTPQSNSRFTKFTGILVSAVIAIPLLIALPAWLVDQFEKASEIESSQSPTEKKRRREFILGKGRDSPNSPEIHLYKISGFKDEDLLLIPNDGTITQVDITKPAYATNPVLSEAGSNLGIVDLSERGFDYISRLTKLNSIKVHRGRDLSKHAIDALAKLPNLENFDARNTTFSDFSALVKLKNLTSIQLSDFISADQVSMLKDLPIRSLIMEEVILDGPMIESICTLKNLQSLKLETCDQVSGKDLARLDSLTNLTNLELNNSPTVTEGGIASITTLGRLRYLSLKQNVLNDHHLEQLAKMTGLISLDVSNNLHFTDIGISHLSKMPALKRLNLDYCGPIQTAVEKLNKLTKMKVKVNANFKGDKQVQ